MISFGADCHLATAGGGARHGGVDDALHGESVAEVGAHVTAFSDRWDPSTRHRLGLAEHVAVGVVHVVAAHVVPDVVGNREQGRRARFATPHTAHLLNRVPVAHGMDRASVAVD